MKSSIINHQQPLEILASAGRFGVIALATDFNIETDLAQLYPKDVRFFHHASEQSTSAHY